MKSFEGDLSACNESEMEELACGGSRGWRVEASLAAATLIGNLFGHKMSKVGNMRKKNFRRYWLLFQYTLPHLPSLLRILNSRNGLSWIAFYEKAMQWTEIPWQVVQIKDGHLGSVKFKVQWATVWKNTCAAWWKNTFTEASESFSTGGSLP